MKYADRNGVIKRSDSFQDRILNHMYGTAAGRLAVRCLVRPWVSKLGGKILNTGLSRILIPPFIKKHKIDLDDFIGAPYRSYNDFFMRRIKPERRPVDMEASHFVSPCDSRLTVYPISPSGKFMIKNTVYTMASLTRSRKIAAHYNGGYAMVFRLCVEDYHRYCFPCDGRTSSSFKIPGIFHTVNPAANDRYPIYKENTREFTFLQSEQFGTLLMMEVGALFVGKIVNEPVSGSVNKGEEKGHFEFGGSTIIICAEKNQILPDADLLRNSCLGIETLVKYGEKIGISIDSHT